MKKFSMLFLLCTGCPQAAKAANDVTGITACIVSEESEVPPTPMMKILGDCGPVAVEDAIYWLEQAAQAHPTQAPKLRAIALKYKTAKP